MKRKRYIKLLMADGESKRNATYSAAIARFYLGSYSRAYILRPRIKQLLAETPKIEKEIADEK